MNPTDAVTSSNPIISEFARTFYKQKIAAIEQSVKILEKKILKDRISVLIDSEDILPKEVRSISKEMGLDDSRTALMLEEFHSASSIGFSIELDDDKTNCRVYIETYPTNRQIKTMKMNGATEVKTITSFKWDISNPKNCIRTNYYTQFYTSIDAVVSAIDKSGFGKAPQFIHDAHLNGKKFTITNASDQNSPRTSFDLKMSDIYLGDVSDDTFEFMKDKIDVKTSLKHLSRFPVYHFGGGVDRNSNKFLNLYFSVYNRYNNQKVRT